MVLTLERLGIPCEFHHHEVASGGQCEIDLRFQTLTRMADQVMTYKYVVKNVARAAGKTVTFMPKPIFGDNGSGMHTHQSLWKEGTPLMADKSGLRGAVAARARLRRPACSSTRRRCSRSARRRRTRTAGSCRATRRRSTSSTRRATARACIRIPMYSDSPKAKRIEFRCPDAAANPYLAFAAMLMAGLDGIQKGLDAGRAGRLRPLRGGPRRRAGAGLAREALDALEPDHEFLTAGGVFSEELIRTWIDYKRENEVDPCGSGRIRPSSPSTTTAERTRVADRSRGRVLGQRTGRRSRAIYEDGIATGTRPSRPRSRRGTTWDALASRRPPARRRSDGRGRRLGGALPVSIAALLRGVAENSVYVAARGAGSGIGRALLERLIDSAEAGRDLDDPDRRLPGERGEPRAARAVRLPGRRHARAASAKLDGIWRDVVLLERRCEVIT